jgi:chromosome segregation ATPase
MPFQEKKEEEKSFALHFFVLTLLLIVFSVWALWEEIGALRPWKTYQKRYYGLKYERTAQELELAQQEFKKPQVQEQYQKLKSLLDKERKELDKPEKQKEYKEIEEGIKEVEKDISSTQNDLLVARNELLEHEYQYMKFRKERNKKKIEELKEKIRILEDRKKEIVQRRDNLKKKFESFTLQLEKHTEKLRSFPLSSRIEELEKLLKSFKNPKIEINQYYIEDLKKVDRCTSCHVGIDNPAQSDYPSPYTTHPAHYVYL